VKLVILDRDGVINYDSADFIKSPSEWQPIPGSLEAIARLNQTGHRVVVASNQSGIGRGLFDMAALNSINGKMYKALSQVGGRIDALFYCPHAQEANCGCRKPAAGLFEEIATRFGISLKGVPAIGDSIRDLECAVAVGAQPMLVLTGKGEKTRTHEAFPKETPVFKDLAEAVTHILRFP
jgi:D-glycero-D-manno-heptose 1,7-bisphosphate phosphatase